VADIGKSFEKDSWVGRWWVERLKKLLFPAIQNRPAYEYLFHLKTQYHTVFHKNQLFSNHLCSCILFECKVGRWWVETFFLMPCAAVKNAIILLFTAWLVYVLAFSSSLKENHFAII